MIKAITLYQDGSGCDYHRLVLPFRYESGYIDHTFNNNTEMDLETRLSEAQLIVWNRDCPIGLETAIDLRMRYGTKLIVDLDDYWELYPNHYLFNHFRRHGVAERILKNIALADAVTVTTDRLANKVKLYNQNVHVIPNALPYGNIQFNSETSQDDIFRFIYAGQRSHLHDLKLLHGPLRRIASEKHHKIGFTLAGYDPSPNDIARTWPKMEHIFSVGGLLPNYWRLENKPLDNYMEVYSSANAALVPLEENTFNSFKSNLKLLEAAAKKLPVICQKVPPYSDCDAPVLWVERQTDWYRHIRYLASNYAAAHDLGQQLYEWAVSKYNLFAWNKYRFDLFTHIVNS